MGGFNRQRWLVPLVAVAIIFVADARSILVNILTADKPLSLRELFLSPWRLPLWFALFGLACILDWLNLKSSRQSPEEQKKQKDYDCRKLLLEGVGARVGEFSRRRTLPKEIEVRWESVRFDQRDEETRDVSRKVLLPGNAVIKQSLVQGRGTTMLILGDRGIGKSTMLYKLAQALLEPANQELDRAFKEHNTLNTSAPMPVVLHLPDWERYCRDKRTRSSAATFQDWVVSALDSQYRIKPEFGESWLEVENLVLLLDGLDELSNCNECVKAIKQFRQDKRTIKIVICCQIQVYESLTMQDELCNTQLGIEQAFCAQTLQPDQIEDFLNQPGEDFEKIRAAYPAMQESFRTPLDLSVIDAACRAFSLQELRGIVQGKEWYPILWKEYVQKMFQQRRTLFHYPKEKVQKWLCWLAKGMQKASQSSVQTRFLIEELQPTWLHKKWQKILYCLICKILNSFKIFLLCLWFSGSMLLGMMVCFAIAAKPLGNSLSTLIERLYDYPPIYKTIYSFLTRIYVPSPLITQEVFFLTALTLISAFQIFLLIEFIYLVSLAVERPEENIRPVEKWRFGKFKEVPEESRGLVILTLLMTAFLGIILFFAWREPKLSDFRVQFLSLFFSVLYFTGFLSLTSVFPELIKIDYFKGVKQRNYANKGIFNSVENFIELGLIVSALSGFLIGLGGSFAWGFNHGLGLGIVGGFFWGIGYGLECSSQTCIPHFALRLVLWLSNFMPWNYRQFLDYAVHLRLLKKEGGAYIFHHPSLQEYFAEMNDDRLMEQK